MNKTTITIESDGVYRITKSKIRIGNLSDLRSRLNNEPKVTRLTLLDKAADNPNSSKQVEQAGLTRLASMAHIHDDSSISLTTRLKNIFVKAYIAEVDLNSAGSYSNLTIPKEGSICIKPEMVRNGEDITSNQLIGNFPMHINAESMARAHTEYTFTPPNLDLIRFYKSTTQEHVNTYLIMSSTENEGLTCLWKPLTPNTNNNGVICMGDLTDTLCSTLDDDNEIVNRFLTPNSWNADLYNRPDTRYVHWEQDADGKINMVYKSHRLNHTSNTIAIPRLATIIEDMNHEYDN